ncbi:MAG: hypothetical protein ACP5UQ_11390, partial [Anaerolineae bacterium]
MQDLRGAARTWGWTIRGTAKATVVEGIIEHLSNAKEMAAAFEQLSATERKMMIWFARLREAGEQTNVLTSIMHIAEEEQITSEVIDRAFGELYRKLFLLADPFSHVLHVPDLYLEWLPESDAPGLVYRGDLADVRSTPGQDWLDTHCARLLAAVEDDRPPLEQATLVQPAGLTSGRPMTGMGMAYQCARPHGGIVSDERLADWGYARPEERALARTLLGLLAIGGLCRVRDLNGTSYLQVDAAQVDAWSALAPGM